MAAKGTPSHPSYSVWGKHYLGSQLDFVASHLGPGQVAQCQLCLCVLPVKFNDSTTIASQGKIFAGSPTSAPGT
jgi:hypothetical protein